DRAAGDRRFVFLSIGGIHVDDGPGGDIALDYRNLKHISVDLADRQERRIGGLPVRAKAGEHDLHYLVIDFQHPYQRLIEAAGRVVIGRGGEFVVEAEAVKKGAQSRIVGSAKARVLAGEGIGNAGQWLAEKTRHHLLVGDVA